MHTTSISLLQRLREPEAEGAWTRFVSLYTPLLYSWAKRLGLEDVDAADLVQDVFTQMLRELPRFSYRPGSRFRGWLWTVTRNKYFERIRRKRPSNSPLTDDELVDTCNFVQEIDEADYNRYVVDRALQIMRSDFEPTTWKACWENVVQGRSAPEVAEELGISANAVHLAKARVLRRLRQELDGLWE